MRNKKGATLVEVLIAIALLSILVVMVSNVLVSVYKTATLLIEIPNEQSKALDAIERKKDTLLSIVKRKGYLENEKTNTSNETVRAVLTAQIEAKDQEINNLLENEYNKKTISLFGDAEGVDVYYFYDTVEGYNISYYSSVVDPVARIRPVPIVETNDVKIGSSTRYFNYNLSTNATDKANCSVTYSSVNREYLFRTYYQWYISNGKSHSVQYSDGLYFYEEEEYSLLLDAYPSDYEPISGETKSTIDLKPEYVGKTLMCLVTPLSQNGAFGTSSRSNYIYINGLPKLNSGSYKSVIDASLLEIDYPNNASKTINCGTSISTITGSDSSVSCSGVVLNALGESISESATRYFELKKSSSSSITESGLSTSSYIFIVAKDNGSNNPDFIYLNSGSGSSRKTYHGFTTNNYASNGSNTNGWKLLMVQVPSTHGSSVTLQLISSNGTNSYSYNVAEMVVYQGTNSDDVNNIKSYLIDKYKLED